MTTKNTKNTIPSRTVTALVNDKPGVLNRITSMLRRRGSVSYTHLTLPTTPYV